MNNNTNYEEMMWKVRKLIRENNEHKRRIKANEKEISKILGINNEVDSDDLAPFDNDAVEKQMILTDTEGGEVWF